jgi:hypothetical protein
MRFVYILLLLLCPIFTSSTLSQFTQSDHFIDLTEREFYYVAHKLDQNMTYEDVMSKTNWESIKIISKQRKN